MSVLIVGSFITDLIARSNIAPHPGQTVSGNSFNTYLGGKGANQAVACKRMGSTTYMVGCLGNDVFGEAFKNFFKEEGFEVNDRMLKTTSEASTGTSLVVIEEATGQNMICMVPGANLKYTIDDLNEIEDLVEKSNVVVSQAEQQEEIVDHLAYLCEKHHKRFIYNPAPARPIKEETLRRIYVLTPNENELGVVVGKPLITQEDYIQASKELISKGVENIVTTLGDKGCLFVSKDECMMIPSFKVKAIDTLGAGDSFTGSMSAMLDQGYQLKEALRIANAVGALEVTKNGGIPSMPYKEDVFNFLKENQ